MKHNLTCIFMGSIICVSALTTVVLGDPAKKGVLLIRRGGEDQKNRGHLAKASFDKDDRDPNGKLMGVSVQCNGEVTYSGSPKDRDMNRLIGNQRGFEPDTRWIANSTCIWNKHGNVQTDPQPGNPNHCVINSVKLSDLLECWHRPS